MARRKIAEVYVDVTNDGKPDRVTTYKRKKYGYVANVQVNVKVPKKGGKVSKRKGRKKKRGRKRKKRSRR